MAPNSEVLCYFRGGKPEMTGKGGFVRQMQAEVKCYTLDCPIEILQRRRAGIGTYYFLIDLW